MTSLQQSGFLYPRIHLFIFYLIVILMLAMNFWVYKNSNVFSGYYNEVSLREWKLNHYKNSSIIKESSYHNPGTGHTAVDKIRIVVKSVLKEDLTWDRWIVEVADAEERSPFVERTDKKVENISRKCNLPNLRPWDPFQSTEKRKKIGSQYDCSKNKGDLLFHTDLQSNLIMKGNNMMKNCCYESVSSPSTCIPITENITKIPAKHENAVINVKCKNLKLYSQKFALVQKYTKKLTPSLNHSLNVIVLGMEGVSYMSFLRNLPLSYDYLLNSLSAIPLNGHSKISETTFSNLMAFQTGGHPKEKVFDKCQNFTDEFDRVDGYPFLFEKFSARGYYTSYADDRFKKNVFLNHCNYKSLWEKQKKLPSDYYLVNLAKSMENDNLSHTVCYGKEMALSVYLDHIEKMATTFKNDRYFQFTWQQMISEQEAEPLPLADKLLLNTLTFLKKKGYLDNTAFILMSDQGLKSGKFRETRRGQLENRNPMAFIVLPPSFPKRYTIAMKNLRDNANKLTTPFDLHETVKAFMDLSRIEDNLLKLRTWEMSKARGLSLFLPYSDFRGCLDAGIPLHQCSCNTRVPYFEDNDFTMEASYFILRKINELLNNNTYCSEIKGTTVTSALRFDLGVNDSFKSYEYGKPQQPKVKTYRTDTKNIGLHITLKTRPCNVIYEASVVKLMDGDWLLSDEMSIISDISNMASISNCTKIPDKLIGFCCCNKPVPK